MVAKPYEDIYPLGLGQKGDRKLDNMIRDILDGCLDESFWAAVREPPQPKEKPSKASALRIKRRKVVTTEGDSVEGDVNADAPAAKNNQLIEKPATQTTTTGDTATILRVLTELSSKIDVVETKHVERYHALKTEMVGEMLGFKNEVVSRFSDMGTKIRDVETHLGGFETKFTGLEAKLAAFEAQIGCFEAKVGGIEAKVGDFDSRICWVEGEQTKATEAGVKEKEADGDEGSTSPSWKLSTKATSDPDCPMSCLVRQPSGVEPVEVLDLENERENETLLIPLPDPDAEYKEEIEGDVVDNSWLVGP